MWSSSQTKATGKSQTHAAAYGQGELFWITWPDWWKKYQCQTEKCNPQKEVKPNDWLIHLESGILGVKSTYTKCSSLETTAKIKNSKWLMNISFFGCEFKNISYCFFFFFFLLLSGICSFKGMIYHFPWPNKQTNKQNQTPHNPKLVFFFLN